MTKSMFRYPGAKTKLLPTLMDHINKIMEGQDSFTDAFIGGGSVLLEVATKYPNIQLYANDKDYWIYCFWKVISDVDSINYFKLLNLIDQQPTLDLFYKLREEQTTDEVQCAYRAIFFNRTAFSGILSSGPIGGKEQKSAYKIDCRYNVKTLRNKMQKCRDLLQGRLVMSNKNFVEYDRLYYNNDPIYLDPPYFLKGAILYYEKMSVQDHVDLSKILQKRKNWVLSYDDCIEISALYSLNNIIYLDTRYCINGKKDSWENKWELIILP
jgi:DNA adenine methylase